MAVQYAYIGHNNNIKIFGWPFITWKYIFDSCYTWIWVTKKYGYFDLINYPMPGNSLKQYNHILDILNIIKMEATRIILKGT